MTTLEITLIIILIIVWLLGAYIIHILDKDDELEPSKLTRKEYISFVIWPFIILLGVCFEFLEFSSNLISKIKKK